MSRLYEEFEKELTNLGRNTAFMSKEVILFSELDLQFKIYTLFAIIGLMMILLGILL